VHVATGSIAAADAVGKRIGGARGSQIVQLAHGSFTTAMGLGMRVAGAVAIAAAVAAIAVLPRSRRARAEQILPAVLEQAAASSTA
jgi:hypothetical protein